MECNIRLRIDVYFIILWSRRLLKQLVSSYFLCTHIILLKLSIFGGTGLGKYFRQSFRTIRSLREHVLNISFIFEVRRGIKHCTCVLKWPFIISGGTIMWDRWRKIITYSKLSGFLSTRTSIYSEWWSHIKWELSFLFHVNIYYIIFIYYILIQSLKP